MRQLVFITSCFIAGYVSGFVQQFTERRKPKGFKSYRPLHPILVPLVILKAETEPSSSGSKNPKSKSNRIKKAKVSKSKTSTGINKLKSSKSTEYDDLKRPEAVNVEPTISKNKKSTTKKASASKKVKKAKKVTKATKSLLKKAEKNQRALLSARLKIDLAANAKKVAEATKSVLKKAEKHQRALLSATLKTDSAANAKKVAKEKKTFLMKAEKEQRALLGARLRMDSAANARKFDVVVTAMKEELDSYSAVGNEKSSTAQKANKSTTKKLSVKKAKRVAEKKQPTTTSKRATTPKGASKHQDFASANSDNDVVVKSKNLPSDKYAAIEDLSERAFAILTDLGAIERTVDPSSPNYDSSKDDEIADENVFINFKN